jgi:energy-coupling factor transporter transmembrane protein EcfT
MVWVLLLIILAVLALAFVPALKGYRTVFLGWASTVITAVIPVLTEITGYLQGLDWREYLLSGDRKNLLVLAVVGGLGVLMVVMRHLTKGAVGEK